MRCASARRGPRVFKRRPVPVMSNAYIVALGPPGAAELGKNFIPKPLVRAMHFQPLHPNATHDKRCQTMSELLLGCPVSIYVDSMPGQQTMVRGTVTGKVRPEFNTTNNEKDYTKLLVDVRVSCILNQMNTDEEARQYLNKGVECFTDGYTNVKFRKTCAPEGINTMSCYLTNPRMDESFLLQLPLTFTPASAVAAVKKTGGASECIILSQHGKMFDGCNFSVEDKDTVLKAEDLLERTPLRGII